MTRLLDPLRLARLDRSAPLTIRAGARGFVCVICGAEQEADAWRVALPERCGPACPGCASDAGWTVR